MHPESEFQSARVAMLRQQYEYVRESRKVLFSFCERISQDQFVERFSSTGNRSIRDIFAHVASTYQFWIGKFGLQQDIHYTENDSINTIHDCLPLFRSIDKLTEAFLLRMENPSFLLVEFSLSHHRQTAEPLRLFTHVLTHEFHHKGQILWVARKLGHIPIDTDIMR